MLNDQYLLININRAIWSLTVGGVSNLWPLVSCLGRGTELRGPGGEGVYASTENVGVGVCSRSLSTTGSLLSPKMLISTVETVSMK